MNIAKQMLIITILGFILSSCFGAVADTMNIEVSNGWYSHDNPVCTGGLKARFEVGKNVLESPLLAARGRYSSGLIKRFPANIWNGVPIKLEA